jgi:diaminohydroxyphosphoribosylaminopyrimidine deaminase/5-amino-6-(5-phosphoribosylamino)uracil reductase
LPAKGGSVDIVELLRLLGKREVVTVLAEGGGRLLGSLFDHRLVDKVLAFVSPIIIGGRQAVSVGGNGVDNIGKALRLGRVDIKCFGDDILVSGYVEERLSQKT